MGQMEHMMAEQVQENEFIDSLNLLIDSAFLNPDEEHSYIYRMNDRIKSFKFIVNHLKMNAMKTLEHYLSIEISQKNMKSLK